MTPSVTIFMLAVSLSVTFLLLGLMIAKEYRRWKQPALQTNEKKINRSLQCVPRTKIEFAARDQVVKIVGQVRALDRTLEAPLSKRKCVLYEVWVEEYLAVSDATGHWRLFLHEVIATDFIVEDDTDQALIKHDNLDVSLRATSAKDYSWESGKFNDAPSDIEDYLQRHGHSSKELGLNKKLRYSEGVFELGETIAAMGTATWEHAPNASKNRGGYRGAGQRMVLGPLPGGSVLLSDNADLVDDNATTRTTDS